uniref:Uncharacterized protein n=1 Tax=Arundo donax TaxID=35708 RepID=A0A0A8ZIQ8_ARUDO
MLPQEKETIRQAFALLTLHSRVRRVNMIVGHFLFLSVGI